jgi:hypothetical protein
MEVTLFITSCGRPHLLKRTLESFMRFNTYPIKEAIICEDSGNINSIDFVKNILNFPCNIIYNEKRIGQMRSIENGVKYITTPYVFHCEDDWEFYCPGFIELSMEILQKNDRISQVLLRSYDEYINRYSMKINHNDNSNYNIITLKEGTSVYSFNPSLKKIEVELLNIPYKDTDDEGTIQKNIQELGYVSVVTKNKNGFVSHIGWNEHVY